MSRPLCAECWCDHYPSECTHYGVSRVNGRWLCKTHAAEQTQRIAATRKKSPGKRPERKVSK